MKYGEIQNFKQEILKTIKILEENNDDNLETRMLGKKQLEKLWKIKGKFIENVYKKERNILETAMKEDKITKENYNRIKKYCEKMKIYTDLVERNEEIINLDLKLKSAFEEIKIEMSEQIKENIEQYFLNINLYGLTASIKNLIEQKIKPIVEQLEQARVEELTIEERELFNKLSFTLEKLIDNIVEEKDLKKNYIKIEKQIKQTLNTENKKEKIDLIKFNNKITTTLLSDSNYNLILNYIYIIQEAKHFDLIKYSLQKFKLAPKEKNREIIIKIVNNFLNNKNENDALYFLNQIGVKKYLNYLPKNKSASEYLEIIDNNCGTFPKLHVQKEIFFEDNYEKYGDTIVCLKEWIKYIENSKDNENCKTLKQIDAITDILLEDIKILENDEEIIKKIEKIFDSNIQMKGISIVKTINLINKILTLETTISQKAEYIKKIKGINAFTYIDGNYDLGVAKIRSNYYSLTIETRIIFNKLLDNIVKENIEDYIYIYMNSNIKYIIFIEEFIKKLLETGSTNIFEIFSIYHFCGNIKKTKNHEFCSLKLLSVYNKSSRILKKDVNGGNEIEDNSLYEVNIKGYDKLTEQLTFKNIKPYKREQYGENKDNKENILEIINIQIEFLDKFIIEQVPQIIHNINNPYKYIEEEKLINKTKFAERMQIINNIKKNKEIVKKVKKEYYERVKNKYKELLNNEKIAVKKIIKYYMNTATKYILPFDELCEMIARAEKREKIAITQEHIIFEDIDEQNNIVGSLQFECNNIKCIVKSLIKKDFSNHLCYYTGRIIMYNSEKKEVVVDKIDYSNLGRNSNEYTKVILTLEEFIKTKDMIVLEKLKNIPTMTELLNKNNIEYSWENYLLRDYKRLYYECISTLINDLHKLKKFLEYLGKNNYWIKQEEGTIYANRWVIYKTFIIEKEQEEFLKKIKETDIETILFCYNHTYFKNTIPPDQLLRNIFRFNSQRKSMIKENGYVDLRQYKIEIVMKIYVNEENTEYNILRNSRFKEGIKAKIMQYNDTMLEQEMYLEILEYDTVNNVLLVKQVVEKKTDNIHINRTLQYLYLAKELFNTKYSIKAVYSFLTDKRTKELNLYDKIKINAQHIKEDLSQISSFVIKDTIKKFREYILDNIEKKAINEKSIKYIFTIYDKTIIRYLISLDEFLNMLQTNYIKCDYNFEVEIVYKKDILEDKHLAYFPRYILTKKIKIINSNQIQLEAQKNYKALIKSYNNSEDTITLEIIEKINYQEKEKVFKS